MPLTPCEDRAAIVVCSTCRYAEDSREAPDGRRGGRHFADAVRRAAAASAAEEEAVPVAVEEMPCLFACSRHCTVHLRAPGKIGYVMGGFAPTAADAAALVAFFRLYRDSAEGQVPFRDWPDGVKGHFIVRTPPPGHLVG